MLTSAALCVSLLMNQPLALPDRWVETIVGPAMCRAVGHPGCAGATIAWTDGSLVIYAPRQWSLLLEELCHVSQWRNGQYMNDPECDQIRTQAKEKCLAPHS